MQKIKNALHLNKDANHNGIPDSQERDRNHNGIPDSQERHTTHTHTRDPIVHDHGTKIPNTIVPPATGATVTTATTTTASLGNDRNMNGIPDNLEGRTHHNPLDRNHDGKVDLKDLKPSAGRDADRNHNGIPDRLEGNNMTDRNHNGIPDQLEGRAVSGSSFGSYSSVETVREAPTIVQVVEKDIVVHEHIHPVEKEEIQPVIYREREQLDVKQITQQLHETQIQPTLVQQRELAAEVRAPVIERAAPIQENIVLPSVDRDATMRSVQVNSAIVNETIKKTVIEEIQPVLERDVFVPTIVQETQPIYEKIVEAPHVYREVLPVRELGSRTVTDYVAPVEVIREVPIVQPALIQPITVTTTTTTTDSFIPAKLVNNEIAHTHAAPTGRKLH